jgi:transposase
MVMARDLFLLDPLSGHLFVLFTMRRDRIRVVYWDRNGFAMWTKRLECGRFRLPRATGDAFEMHAMEAAELGLIV